MAFLGLARRVIQRVLAFAGLLFFCSVQLSLAAAVNADAAVVVHPENRQEISDQYLRSLFLGKRSIFPDGSKARVFLPESPSKARRGLLTKVILRSESQLMTFWAQLRFTGRGQLPVVLSDDAVNIRQLVADNETALSVIDADKVDSSVRVIRWIKEMPGLEKVSSSENSPG